MRKKLIFTNPGGTEFAEVPATTRMLTNELATRDSVAWGASEFQGVLGWLPNPDPVLSLGNGQNGMGILTDLLSDAQVAGAIQARKAATLAQEWMLDTEGVEDDFPDKVLKPWLDTLNVPRIISDILDATSYGVQPLEIIWEFTNKYGARDNVLPTDVMAKPADWFFFDTLNHLRFRAKNQAQGTGADAQGIELPPRKFLVAQHHPTYANPYGQPTLSKCYWPVVFKRGAFRFWVTYVEKYGMPWVMALYDTAFYNITDQTDPANPHKPHISQLLSELDNMAQDGVFAFPKQGLDLQIANQGPAAKADNYQQLVAEANREISKAILGHGAALDSTPGKLGNEQMATLASQEVTQADKQLVENVMNQLLGWVYELNFQPKGKRAKFVLYQEENVDLDQATRDKVLWDMGVRWTSEYVESVYGIPAGQFTIDGEAGQVVGGAMADLVNDATDEMNGPAGTQLDAQDETENQDGEDMDTFSEKNPCQCPACKMARATGGVYFTAAGEFPDQMALDRMADTLTPEMLQFQAGQMVQTVQDIMQKAAGKPDPYAWAQEQLSIRFPDVNTAALEKVMQSVTFIGLTLGRHSAQLEAENEG